VNLLKARGLVIRGLSIPLVVAIGTLLISTTLSRLSPRGGVIALGVLVFVAVEASRYRFKSHATPFLIIFGAGSALVWGWLGPFMGDFWPMVLARGVFLGWVIYCWISGERKSWRAPSTAALTALGLAITIALLDHDQLFFLLSYGYDNSAHVPALAHSFRHHGFLYAGTLPDNFTFGNYVNGYPPLQAATWALAMSAGGVKLGGGYEIMHYFAYFNFLFGLLLSGLVVQIWVGRSRETTWNHINAFTRILGWVFIACSQISFVFWMGFPPFLFGCVVVLASLAWCESIENEALKLLSILLGLTLLNYSYPLLSPALALTAAGLLLGKRHIILEATRHHWMYALWVISLLLASNYPVVKKTLALSAYLDDGGGIQPINLWFLGSVVVLCIAAYLLMSSRGDVDLALILTFGGSLVSYAALAVLSKIDRGYISYYPQKSGYLALLVSFAMIGRLEVIHNDSMMSTSKRFLRIFMPIAVSVLIVSALSTRTTSEARFGFPSTLSVLSDVATGAREGSTACFREAMALTEDIQYLNDTEVILFESDLSTRWINAVRGRLSDATYSLAIPLNSPDLDITAHISDWLSQYPTTSLIVLHGTESQLEGLTNSRVKLRQLACLT